MKINQQNVSMALRIQASIVILFSAVLFINYSTAYSAPPDADTCAFLKRFHGHTCPGSLMGLRLGLAAKEALKAEGRIEAKTFLLACSVDGIQVATGATYGNKAITVEDRKEMSLILIDTKTGKQVEAHLTEEAMERGEEYRELKEKSRSLKSGSPEQLAITEKIDEVLEWYRTAPDETIVTINALKKEPSGN